MKLIIFMDILMLLCCIPLSMIYIMLKLWHKKNNIRVGTIKKITKMDSTSFFVDVIIDDTNEQGRTIINSNGLRIPKEGEKINLTYIKDDMYKNDVVLRESWKAAKWALIIMCILMLVTSLMILCQ